MDHPHRMTLAADGVHMMPLPGISQGSTSYEQRPYEGATMTTRQPDASDYTTSSRSPAAVGLIIFAGIMMIMIGVFEAIQGLVALFNDEFYVVGQEWVFEFDITA